MKLSNESTDPNVEQGRAIARGMEEIRVQKEKNLAREDKRMKSMLRNAANREMFR